MFECAESQAAQYVGVLMNLAEHVLVKGSSETWHVCAWRPTLKRMFCCSPSATTTGADVTFVSLSHSLCGTGLDDILKMETSLS